MSALYVMQVCRPASTLRGQDAATHAETTADLALCIARTPEGRADVAEEAVRQAEAEGLTLQPSDNAAGYGGVSKNCVRN